MPDPSPELVVVEAPWCHNCRALAPLLEEVAAAHPGVALVRVDASREPAGVAASSVRGTPTLIGLAGGEERFRATGVRTRAELEDMFATLMNGSVSVPVLGRADGILRLGAGLALLAAGGLLGAVPLITVGLSAAGWGAATIMRQR